MRVLEVFMVLKKKKVTEELDLLPISTYNKTKMIAENVLMSYKKIQIHCVRPATVCGLSPRMRFDVSVNLLTMHALKNKYITVFGGKQIRTNIHIQDMVNVYLHFLKKKNLPSGAYNAGFENLSIMNIAKKIQKITKTKIIVKKSNDPRSYRQFSEKLLKTGYVQRFTVDNAVRDIIKVYSKKKIENNAFTVKWMKKLKLDR